MSFTSLFYRIVRLPIAAVAIAVITTTTVTAQEHGAAYEVVANFENPMRHGADPIARLMQASDGTFYGTTSAGGRYGRGTIFNITATGVFTSLHDFTGDDGATPVAPLVQGSDGNLYGTTLRGGALDLGTVFKLDQSGLLTSLHSFDGADGQHPQAGLIQATDGRFYGTTAGISTEFGAGPGGTVFRIDAAGTFDTLYHFTDGRHPHVELIQARDGSLYGGALLPGFGSAASIFKSDLAGAVTTLRTFAVGQGLPGPLRETSGGLLYGATVPTRPNVGQVFFTLDNAGTFSDVALGSQFFVNDSLVQAGDGNFYGTRGTTVIRMNASGQVTLLQRQIEVDEPVNSSTLILATDGSFWGMTTPGTALGYAKGTVFSYDLTAGSTALYRFGGANVGGGNPTTGVIQGTDGRLYGTAPTGGAFGRGTVFTVDATGIVQALHSFEGPHGHPEMGLVQARDGYFYGTTIGEGTDTGGRANGVLFFIDTAGSFGVLTTFGQTFSSRVPRGALLDGGDGFLYGPIYQNSGVDRGAVFRRGAFREDYIHIFSSTGSEGTNPSAELFQAPDGSFYGTTSRGIGPQGIQGPVLGSVFKFVPTTDPNCAFLCAESFTTLHTFAGLDGATPLAPVRLGSDGRFYGTTSEGGSFDGGTAFAMEASGNVTTLHAFGGPDGRQPLAGLLQASDGNFYGSTCQGGAGFGTLFRIDATGGFTTLHSFSGTNGSCPSGELIQASDGHLYGTTRSGGQENAGVLFRVRLATTTPVGYVEIVSRNSGKCLDVFGASTDAGAQAIQWTCHGGLNQQWRLEPAGGGAFRIVARHSEQALDVYGALVDDLAPIIQWPVHGGDNQAWTLEPASDGHVRIVARHSGKAMDVEFASTDEGARIIQYTPHGGANQQWLLRPVGSTASLATTVSEQ